MAGSGRGASVVLTAQVGNFLSGVDQAAAATKKLGNDAAKTEQQLGKQHQAMTTLGTTLGAVGAVAAAGVALAISKYAEFDAQMSSVQAATHETAENMNLLRDAAIEAGASTAFSATDAARAIEELSKAGVTTKDILGGGLKGALDLAAAGELDVGQAAEIAATAMTQFNQKGSEVPHIADLLAAGAGKAQGSVDDLSQALKQGGLVASQAGFSIEETTGTLSAFAAAGLIGSDAGTSLKTAILALQNPSTKSAAAMKEYGLEVYNADGTMKSFSEIAGVLQGGLGSLSDEQRNAALATIFGNDAVRAANVLYANGTDGINSWTRKVDDAGFAAETAAIKQDNLAGDLEKLGGAFDTLLIKTGSAADGPLRAIVQSVTNLVDAFSDAPPIVQNAALGFGVLTAALGLGGGAVLLIIPKVYELKVALDVLASSSIPGVGSAATGMAGAVTKSGTALAATAKFLTGPWGVALAAASVGVKLLSDYLESLKASSEEFQNVIATGTSASDLFEVADEGRIISYLDEATSSAEVFQEKLNLISTSDFGTGLDLSAQQLRQSLKDIGEELSTTADTDLPTAQAAFAKLGAETDGSKEQLLQLLNAMPAYRDALTEQATAAGQAATDTNLLEIAQGGAKEQAATSAEKYIAQAESVDQVADAISGLLEQFNTLNGVNQDAVSANADYQESLANISTDVDRQKEAFIQLQKDGYEAANGSLDGFVGTLDGFSLSLDENTVSGSANASSLSSVAKSAQDAALAQFEVDKTTMGAKGAADKYAGTLADQRAKFEASATAAGYNADEVKRLGDKVFALPTSKQINVLAETAAAQSKIDNLVTLNSGRVVRISVQATNDSPASWTGGLTKADGGEITGVGGPRQDNIPVWASVGEHVLDARDVQLMGGQSEVYRFRQMLNAGQRPNFADGGAVAADGGTWSANRSMTGASISMGAPQVSVSPMVSLAGAKLVMSVGGRQIEAVIQDQIVASDRSSSLTARMGKQGR
jgi:TP901 family phage tail tape measure protein